jgi:hypothetical protein
MNRREALQRTAAITGIAMSSSVSLGLLNGCTPSGKPTWPPLFLKQEEIVLVSAIADTILPKTDTVGALDVHVPEFIDLMLQDCFSAEEQNSFREGLTSFMMEVDTNYSNTFEDCTQEERMKIIEAEEDRSTGQITQTRKKSFYQIVKELTLLGFFSSESVMTTLLDYHPIPGRYDGCIPFNAEGRLFADNNV